MRRRLKVVVFAVLVLGAAAGAVAIAAPRTDLTGVPTANTRSLGYAPASVLSPELTETVVAQGSMKVENPNPAAGGIAFFGYDNDFLNTAGQPVMVASTATTPANTEAHKTEPDKNTYLVFDKGLDGANPNYDYGTHFLFQGHEGGSPGYITRINLDADPVHRITVLATKDINNNDIATIDGSTWDPWAKRLLFTTESASKPTYSATPDYPSQVVDVSPALGRGGYEGIQDDSDGNLWILEDIGGGNKPAGCVGAACTKARIPNSFVFRYVPKHPGDLESGKLQVLQVLSAPNTPITQATQTAAATADQVALHTYGNVFDTKWVTVHDTAVDPPGPFNANLAAKAHDGTPFKRPENGLFRPDGHFTQFFFDETGDTNASSPENACCGGWDSVFKLTQKDPSADVGKLTLFFKGDQAHAGFDNVAFFSGDLISFVEDAGDTLHGQRNALDSAFLLDVTKDYSDPANQPLRWLAQGRDPSATVDADAAPKTGILDSNGNPTTNDGDNEITGLHVSDGRTDKEGILGQHEPHLFDGGPGPGPGPGDHSWRLFYTQQHGDNVTYEVTHN